MVEHGCVELRMENDYLNDIFEPYDRLVTIDICGTEHQVPENNTILRGLQYIDIERVSDAELCWNGECLDCQVWIKNGDKEKAVMSCRTDVSDGMVITRISEALR